MNDNIEWVLVPREPTEAMWNAGKHFCDGHVTRAVQTYAAMLAFAPKPEAQAAGVDAELLQLLLDAAHALDPLGYARGSEQEHEKLAARLDAKRFAMKAALTTPASHDAQQPVSAGMERLVRAVTAARRERAEKEVLSSSTMGEMWLALEALVQQPAVVGDGFAPDVGEILPDGWERDCQGKEDYDAGLLQLSCRYYPANYRSDGRPSVRASVYWGDGIRCCKNLVEKDIAADSEAEVKAMAEQWAREQIDVLSAALTPAATPGDGEALLRLALADAYRHGEKHAPFAMEDCVRKVMAAQKEGNGNG